MADIIKTKISKGFQTVVPAEIRSRFHGEPGDEIIWSIIGDQVFIRIKKHTQHASLRDLIGKYATEIEDNATENIDNVVYGETFFDSDH